MLFYNCCSLLYPLFPEQMDSLVSSQELTEIALGGAESQKLISK